MATFTSRLPAVFRMSAGFPTIAPRALGWVACLLLASQLAGAPAARAQTASAGLAANLPAPLAVALSYDEAERDVFAKAEAGKLVTAELFSAALVAGGVSAPEEHQAYEARFRQLAGRLQRRLHEAGDGADDAATRAAVVHALLHEEILTGAYDLGCSRVSQAMDTGRYNCVSATILFNALAAEVGLETSGGESPAHVVSIVRTLGAPLHVETTCPRWFELRGSEAAHVDESLRDSHTRLGETRPRAVSAQGNGPPPRPATPSYRTLETPQLAALVYYNVAVDLAEQRRFAQAIAANYKALRLDPSAGNARTNLLAAINNWALDLAQRDQFAEAIELLAHGRAFAPDHPTFAINDAALHERWARSLVQPK